MDLYDLKPEMIQTALSRIRANLEVFVEAGLLQPGALEAALNQIALKDDLASAVQDAVLDVHTPELARMAGLPDNPGFDLLSIRPGNEKRAIEVKGRAGTGDIEVSANEWAKACNMREGYWLYAVYDCASPSPQLVRVQDPFEKLLAKAKGSVLIKRREIMDAFIG